MNTFEAFLADLARRDITVRAVADGLKVDAPRGALTPQDEAFFREHKAAILARLRTKADARSSSGTNTQPKARSTSELTRRPRLVRLADVAPEEVEYLWQPYLPRRKLTLLEGDPKVGKSWFAMTLAAIVSRGDPFPGPDGAPGERREPASVVYMSAEDALADTVRVRLDKAGADVERVYALAGFEVHDPKTGKVTEHAVTLADLDVLEETLTQLRPALVVVDPIQAYLGAGVDMHRANEVRPLLAGLVRLAERHRCAMLAIRHLTKDSKGKPLYRGLGSIDFTAAARSILLAGRDPQNPARRAVVHVACSNAPEGPSLGYEVRDGQFAWTGVSSLTAGSLLAPDPSPNERHGDRDDDQEIGHALADAERFLHELLAEGPVAVTAIDKARDGAGITKATLRRAKDRLRVQSLRRGFGPGATYLWGLPEPVPAKAAVQSETLMEAHAAKGDRDMSTHEEGPANSGDSAQGSSWMLNAGCPSGKMSGDADEVGSHAAEEPAAAEESAATEVEKFDPLARHGVSLLARLAALDFAALPRRPGVTVGGSERTWHVWISRATSADLDWLASAVAGLQEPGS